MELIQLLKIAKKNLLLILIIGLITGLAALAFNSLRPLTYNLFFAINISQTGIDKTADYKFDNYYSGQATDLFSDSFEKWFRDPQLTLTAFQKAGINLEDIEPQEYSRLVKARKLAPQYVEVNLKVRSSQEGEQVYQSLKSILEEKVSGLRGENPTWFKLNFTPAVISPNQWNSLLVTTLAFISGLFLGLFIALLRHYWQQQK